MLKTKELDIIQSLVVGETVYQNDQGSLSMTLINKPNVKINQFFSDLMFYTKIFGLSLDRNCKKGILNQDPNPDDRWKHIPTGKPKSQYPPPGYDGYVIINPDIPHKEIDTGRVLPLNEIVLHELLECWAKVKFSLQYIHAHRYATDFIKKME